MTNDSNVTVQRKPCVYARREIEFHALLVTIYSLISGDWLAENAAQEFFNERTEGTETECFSIVRARIRASACDPGHGNHVLVINQICTYISLARQFILPTMWRPIKNRIYREQHLSACKLKSPPSSPSLAPLDHPGRTYRNAFIKMRERFNRAFEHNNSRFINRYAEFIVSLNTLFSTYVYKCFNRI